MSQFAIVASRIVTCDEARETTVSRLGVLTDHAVVVEGDRIRAIVSTSQLSEFAGIETIVSEGLLTPGLVDAHTHLPFAGSRHAEYLLKIAGADYETIAREGGGIVSSARAVREASREAIARLVRERLARMAALGVTTVECKSGYGLDLGGERKQLGAVSRAARASQRMDLVARRIRSRRR
jgi:imidazolonepropionase